LGNSIEGETEGIHCHNLRNWRRKHY